MCDMICYEKLFLRGSGKLKCFLNQCKIHPNVRMLEYFSVKKKIHFGKMFFFFYIPDYESYFWGEAGLFLRVKLVI